MMLQEKGTRKREEKGTGGKGGKGGKVRKRGQIYFRDLPGGKGDRFILGIYPAALPTKLYPSFYLFLNLIHKPSAAS